jgi:hypothetical protein
MAGKKGMKGGGARPNSGGARKGAGRPPGITGTPGKKEGTVDVMPRELSITERKWYYAEKALRHAARMLEILVEIAEDTEQSGSARVAAAGKILDRALGKAPAHVDISAIRHTEIVYRSAAEIRQALIDRGAPAILLDLKVEDPYVDEEEEKAEEKSQEKTE